MLHLFRNNKLRNTVMGALITTITVVFAIQFGPSSGGGSSGPSLKELFVDKCAAKVHGSCIDPKTQRAVYRLLTPRDESGAQDADRAKSMELGRITLDGLIERELLVREAARLGISVTDEDVTESIFRGQILVSTPSDNPMLAYYLRVNDGRLYAGFKDPKTKRFDQKAYERTVRMYTGRSPAEFRDWQKSELLAATLRDIVRAPVRVSDAEAFTRYVAEKSNATLEYVELDENFVKRYSPEPSVAAVDAWEKDPAKKKLVDDELAAKKEAFKPKEKHIRHILVKVTIDAAQAEKEKAARTLLAAQARLRAGDSFATVAAAFSEDSSAEMGGDVGDQTSGFVEPFKLAADALKPGGVTDAIESQFGWHIIAKDDPSKPLDEAKLRAEIGRRIYRDEKAKTTAEEFIKQVIALGAAATDSKISELSKAWDDKATARPGGALLIKRLAPAQPQGLGAADAGAAHAATDAGVSHDAGAAHDAGAVAVAASDAGAPPAEWTTFTVETKPLLASEDVNRPQPHTTGSFNRGGDPIDGVDAESTAKLSEFAFTAKVGDQFPTPVSGQHSLFAVRLKEQSPSTREDYEKNRSDYTLTLLAAKRAEALALYVKRLRDASKSDIQVIAENAINDKATEKDDKSDPNGDDDPQ